MYRSSLLTIPMVASSGLPEEAAKFCAASTSLGRCLITLTGLPPKTSLPMPDRRAGLMLARAGSTGTVTGHRSPRGPEQGSGAGTAFHRESCLKLAPLPTAASCARLHAVHVLHEWGLRELADDAAVVVSELITNAADASIVVPGHPAIALRLLADGGSLMIEAWDQSPL